MESSESLTESFQDVDDCRQFLSKMLGSEGVQSYLKQRRKALGLEPTATLLSDSKDAEGSELEGNEQPLNTEMEDEVKVKVEEESKDGNEGKDKEVNEDEGIELLKAPAGLGEAQVTDQTRKLYEACLEGDFDKVRQAIQGGANLTLCDYSKKKQSAAHLLALSGNIKALRLLVRNGAGVRARDVEGYTPLHYAAKRGDGDMCDVLIALGARVTDANKLGQNAIDTSEFNGHVALSKTLHEYVQVDMTRRRYSASADLHEPPTSQQQLDDYLRQLEHEELLEEERSKRRTQSKNQGLGVSTSRPRSSSSNRKRRVTTGRNEEDEEEDEEGPEDLPPWFR